MKGGGQTNERDASEASIPRVQNNISKNIDKCEILVYVIHDIGLPLNTYPTISPATIVIAISITIPIIIFLESQHFDLLLIIKYFHLFSVIALQMTNDLCHTVIISAYILSLHVIILIFGHTASRN